jgi:hypothetical protein
VDTWGTLEAYWTQCLARGDKPKPVFAIVERGEERGSAHGPGALVTWSLSRREAKQAWHWAKITRMVRITIE